MSNKDLLKKAVLEGTIESLMLSLLGHLQGAAAKAGQNYLESKFGGFGTNDETLYLSACTYAVKELAVTTGQLRNFQDAISSLTPSEKRRVIAIIGKDEQDVTIKRPVLENGQPVCDKKGNPLSTEQKVKANARGAQMIALLAPMSKDEIVSFLRSSNALDTMDNRIKDLINTPQGQKVKQNLQDFGNDAKGFLKKKSWLVDLAERKSGKTIHKP